ncbi:MAG: hypothetical protein AAGA31_04905 [Bacteroidota bacterium]
MPPRLFTVLLDSSSEWKNVCYSPFLVERTFALEETPHFFFHPNPIKE